MQVAFIRKNTSELRKKLAELGCKICTCCYFKDAEWLEVYIRDTIKEIHGIGYTDDIDLLDIDRLPYNKEKILEKYLSETQSFDCGQDEDLFLATITNNKI